MAISKKVREQVRLKFGGLCAYTGKPLDDKWQVDHVTPKHYCAYHLIDSVDEIENLLPAIRIINHYKRSHNLESFRMSMKSFHLRLAKLPKNTSVESTKRRISYMNEVADIFGITVEKPFTGKFYFETLNQNL